MGTEIERKFLVPGDFPKGNKSHSIKQGYITEGTLTLSDSTLTIHDTSNRVLYALDVKSDADGIRGDMRVDDSGELHLDDKHVARIRIRDNEGFITLKGSPVGLSTPEYEYQIPHTTGDMLLNRLTSGYIHKIRHIVPYGGKVWEVDEFLSPVSMVLGEVELSSPDEHVLLPDWVGKEVTGDSEYFNSTIAKRIDAHVGKMAKDQSSHDFVGIYLNS